ncbi:MAG: FUSC family protein [Actinomycetota bacterium]|nr:FUSC family protein [Actinomycetota bacterium]
MAAAHTADRRVGRIGRIWRELIRWDAAGFHPAHAIVSAAGLALPLGWGLATGHMVAATAVAIGALLAGFASFQGNYRTKGTTMVVAGSLSAVAFAVGSAASGSFPALLVAFALAGIVGGMAVALGQAAAVVGLQPIVALAVGSGLHRSPLQAAVSGALVLSGALGQTVLNVLTWPVEGFGLERSALALSFAALADYALSPPTDTASAPEPLTSGRLLQALADPQPLGRRSEWQAICSLAALADGIRTGLPAVAVGRRLFPPGSAEWDRTDRAMRDVGRSLTAAAAVLDRRSSAHRRASPAAPQPALGTGWRKEGDTSCSNRSDQLTEGRDAGDTPPSLAAVDGLVGQARAALAVASGMARRQAPASALRHFVSVPSPVAPARSGAGSDHHGGASDARAHRPVVRRRYAAWTDARATLAAQLSLSSPAVRHALRLSAVLVAAEGLVRWIDVPHGYWAPMTAALVLKPEYAATLTRGAARFAGTLAGVGLVSLAAFLLAPGGALVPVAVVCVMWAGYASFLANYTAFTACVTAAVLLLVSLAGQPVASVAPLRLVDTVLGGSLALGMYVAWPTWEADRIGPALASMVDALSAYGAALLDALDHPPEVSPVTLSRLRHVARSARSDAEASVARMVDEPQRAGPAALHIATSLLSHVQQFVVGALALEATLDLRTDAAGRDVAAGTAAIADQPQAQSGAPPSDPPAAAERPGTAERAAAAERSGPQPARILSLRMGHCSATLRSSTDVPAKEADELGEDCDGEAAAALSSLGGGTDALTLASVEMMLVAACRMSRAAAGRSPSGTAADAVPPR